MIFTSDKSVFVQKLTPLLKHPSYNTKNDTQTDTKMAVLLPNQAKCYVTNVSLSQKWLKLQSKFIIRVYQVKIVNREITMNTLVIDLEHPWRRDSNYL